MKITNSKSALITAEQLFNIQPSDPLGLSIAKLTCGTIAKAAAGSVAMIEYSVAKPASFALGRRSQNLTQYAHEAVSTFKSALESLNCPFAPTAKTTISKRWCQENTKTEGIQGPTATSLVKDFALKNQRPLLASAAIIASRVTLYYFGLESDPKDPTSSVVQPPSLPDSILPMPAPQMTERSYFKIPLILSAIAITSLALDNCYVRHRKSSNFSNGNPPESMKIIPSEDEETTKLKEFYKKLEQLPFFKNINDLPVNRNPTEYKLRKLKEEIIDINRFRSDTRRFPGAFNLRDLSGYASKLKASIDFIIRLEDSWKKLPEANKIRAYLEDLETEYEALNPEGEAGYESLLLEMLLFNEFANQFTITQNKVSTHYKYVNNFILMYEKISRPAKGQKNVFKIYQTYTKEKIAEFCAKPLPKHKDLIEVFTDGSI